MAEYTCKKCGAVYDVPALSICGPHIKHSCPHCNAYVKFEKQDPLKFIMPYGKFKGKTFDEIAVTNIGYMDWLIQNVQGSIGEAAYKWKQLRSQNNEETSGNLF